MGRKKNSSLQNARRVKNDEFYTMFCDVENEIQHYKHHFIDKVVFCNCDDPAWSAFWKYFHLNFFALGLKKLISTHYTKQGQAYKLEYSGGNDSNTNIGTRLDLSGDGDFRSRECVSFINEADVVVTNPPFSLFRSYISVLLQNKKEFLVIGGLHAVKYKEVFPHLMNNEMWLGINKVCNFYQPDGSLKKFGNVVWYTNLEAGKKNKRIHLWKKYTPEEYPKYDNYDAIDVKRVSLIPCDYNGVMGVPISFMSKYTPNQFEIVGEFNHGSDGDFDLAKPVLNGKEMFPRIAIRKVR